MSSELEWNDDSSEDKQAILVEQDSDEEEDWENLDLSDEEREEERKLKEEEEKRKKAEEELRRLKEAEKNRGPQKKSHASKKTTGMYKKYNEAQADLDTASDLFAGTGFEQLHVELLEPASKKDFQEYGQIVGDMIVKHAGGKEYQSALNDIITRATKFHSIKDLKQLKNHIDTLILMKSNEKKNKNQPKKKTFAKVENAIPDSIDKSLLEGVAVTKEEALEQTAEEEWDSDDDFM